MDVFLPPTEVERLKAKVVTLKATIAGFNERIHDFHNANIELEEENKHLQQELRLRATLVRIMSDCWSVVKLFVAFQFLFSRMHQSPCGSCLLLIAYPNLPGVRNQRSTSD